MALKKGVRMKTELPFAPFMFVASAVGAFTTFSPILAIAIITQSLWR
jgi:prepilin signal peptidase PulO-like enzyme (type II secretory pathway)